MKLKKICQNKWRSDNFKYADDAVIMANSEEKLLDKIVVEGDKMGLKRNALKQKTRNP